MCSTLSVASLRITNCSTVGVTTVWLSTVPLTASQVCLVNCSTDNVTTVCQLFHWQCHNSLSTVPLTMSQVCLLNCSTDSVTTVCQLFHWQCHKSAFSTVPLTVSQQSVLSTVLLTVSQQSDCQLFHWQCHNSLPCQLFHWQCNNSLPCQLFHWRCHNSLTVNRSTDGVTSLPCQLFNWRCHNSLSTVPMMASQPSALSTVPMTASQQSDCQLFHWRLHNSLSCQLFLRQIADSCSHKPGGRSCILCSKGGSNPQLTALPPSLQATGSCERKTEGRRKKGRKSSNGKRTSSQAPDVAAALCAPPPLTCPLWWKMSEFRGSSSSALAKQSMASLFKSFWISKLPFLIKALAATCHIQQKEPVQVSIITTPSVQQSKRGTVKEWSAPLAWEQAASGLNLGLSTDPPSTDISPPWPYLPPPFWLVHTHTHTHK